MDVFIDYVYFMRDPANDAVTIGHSGDPESRRRNHQRGNPTTLIVLGMIPGGAELESALHRRFAHIRIEGRREWFKGTPELYAAIDALVNPPPILFGRTIRNVYLAGKITGNEWRQPILGMKNPRYEQADSQDVQEWFYPRCISVPGSNVLLNYTGPYRMDISGGHGVISRGAHAYGSRTPDLGLRIHIFETDGDFVRKKCLEGVASADLVFAWIDSLDCFGTLAEITYAYSLRASDPSKAPLIVIATPIKDAIEEELWFVIGMADDFRNAKTPESAWERLWKFSENPVGKPSEHEYRSVAKTTYELEFEENEGHEDVQPTPQVADGDNGDEDEYLSWLEEDDS